VIESSAPKPSPRPAPRQAPAPAQSSGGGRHAAEPSLGTLVSDATTHLSTLIHSEIELAKLELRSSVKNAGVGIGLFGAAAVVLIFSLTFAFVAAAEGIAVVLPQWAGFLIIFGLQLVAVGLCVWIGIKKVKRVRAPQRTLSTTRETVDYLKKTRGQ
jgi:hypothetical protein